MVLLFASSEWGIGCLPFRRPGYFLLEGNFQTYLRPSGEIEPEIARAVVFNHKHPLANLLIGAECVVFDSGNNDLLRQRGGQRVAFIPVRVSQNCKRSVTK